MNLEKLFAMQKELDEYIARLHPPEPGERRIYSKVLALLVEIGELANETRCFKFWSVKPPAPRERILEEAADVLHFLLSIGNDAGAEPKSVLPRKKENLTEQLLRFYCDAQLCYVKEQWSWVFALYLGLIDMLGFTWDEIEEAYMRKNEVNHKRQDHGY